MLGLNKHMVARLFRRMPWLGVIGQRVWKLGQPRYTLGAVAVVVNDAGQVLLLEHVFHAQLPWGLPGGWVGRRENPAETVVREIREETGLDVRVVCPLFVALGIYPTHVDLAFLCEVTGGTIELSGEILAYKWCNRDELPRLFPFQQAAVDQAMSLRELA